VTRTDTAIIIIFIALLPGLGLSCATKENTNAMDNDTRERAVLSVIHSRRSVRSFTERPVSQDDLQKLVRAAMASPTGKNKQPWAFYIITNEELLEKLGSELPTAAMLKLARAAIMVCGDISKADTTSYRNYWVMDCSAASENILLAAEAMSLGACWTAVFPYDSRLNTVREHISLPAHHVPLNIIPVGYPTGKESPKDKWDPGNVTVIN